MARLVSIEWANRYFACDRMQRLDGSKRIGHNTTLHAREGGWALRYHATDVVEYTEGTLPNGDAWRLVKVRTGGYRTKTTAQRIHHGLAELGLSLSTTDIKDEWRIVQRHKGFAWTMRDRETTLRQVNGSDWQRVAA